MGDENTLHEVNGIDTHRVHRHDVVVVGSGLAALRAALEVAPFADVAVITKVYPTRSHSGAAQGGIAAALANMEEDHWEWHMFDTVKGSDWLGDQDAIEILTREAPDLVYEMEHLGVPFSRTPEGRIMQRKFGGHTRQFGEGAVMRACYAADRTGHVLLHTLWEQCLKHKVRLYNEFYMMSLVIREGRCLGVTARDIATGEIHVFGSQAVMLGTGGYAKAFKICTNAHANTGDGLSMILRAGYPIEDMEFVQFHPTGLWGQGILLSEGARGEGAYLLNKDGERFMKKYAPKVMELASRDVVSRAEQTEVDEGRGIDGKDYVYLDLRHLGKDAIREKLPQIHELGVKFLGIDCIKDPVPIQPTAHYSMGGIPVDLHCRVLADGKETPIKGLYAAGECSCVSVHGANRLGCNSLLDASLYGRRAGRSLKAQILAGKEWHRLPEDAAQEALQEVATLKARTGSEKVGDLRKELQEVMFKDCGVYRTEEGLKRALSKVKDLQHRFKNASLADKGKVFNTELFEALELGHMLEYSECIVASALNRTESRGAHARKDFATRDDKHWLKHTLTWRTEEGVKFDYRPVVITRFPPKERVY